MDFMEMLRNDVRTASNCDDKLLKSFRLALLKAIENLPAHHGPGAKKRQIEILLNKLSDAAAARGNNVLVTEAQGWLDNLETLSNGGLWATAA